MFNDTFELESGLHSKVSSHYVFIIVCNCLSSVIVWSRLFEKFKKINVHIIDYLYYLSFILLIKKISKSKKSKVSKREKYVYFFL